MTVYRIVFANNEIVSSNPETVHAHFNGEYYYEHNKGKLVFALVKAETEENALTIGDIIIKEVKLKVFGNDFEN